MTLNLHSTIKVGKKKNQHLSPVFLQREGWNKLLENHLTLA